jgi:hypothetical protein
MLPVEAQQLRCLVAGVLRRLLIAAPPGSAKSTYASVLFPAWYLCRHPDHQIICASHTAELSEKHARRARNLIMEHGTTLGVELADDSQSAGRWSLNRAARSLPLAQAARSLASGPTRS